MKFAEMNYRQKKAFVNMVNASNWLIGELENGEMDGDKTCTEQLNDHEGLVNELYRMTTTEFYDGNGSCCFDKRTVGSILRDINFCGETWIRERCEKRITKLGY